MAQAQRGRQMRNNTAIAKQAIRDFVVMGAVVAAVVLVVIFFIRMRSGNSNNVVSTAPSFTESDERFLSGVRVNGVNMEGMTYDEGYSAVERQIANRLASPINLTYEGRTFTITPQQLGVKLLNVDNYMAQAWAFGHVGSVEQRREQIAYLQNGGDATFNCELEYDEAALDSFINEIKVNVDKRYRDAVIVPGNNETFQIEPHEDGRILKEDELRQQIIDVMQTGTSANIALVPAIWHPQVSTELAQACTTLIAQRVTDATSSNPNRNKNIIRALRDFRQMTVMPGKTVSFNNVVGKRTPENGFYLAPEIVDGQLEDGYGGGTCQASSTLFPALIEAGMTIEQRWQHSQRVAYCNPSQDSTVTDRGKDLVFTNNTDYPIFIFAHANNAEAIVRIYGKKPEYRIKYVTEREKTMPSKGFETIPDTSRKYVKSPGQTFEKTKAKDGYVTNGVIEYYNWETKELVDRVQRFHDTYEPVKAVYYVWAD